jgi:hypothetical protein
MLALLWTDDSSVRRVVFHELLPAFFARPQDASAVHLEVLITAHTHTHTHHRTCTITHAPHAPPHTHTN